MSFFPIADYDAVVTLLEGITISSGSSGYVGIFDPGHGPSEDELVSTNDPENPRMWLRWKIIYEPAEGGLDPAAAYLRRFALLFRVWIENGPNTFLALQVLEDVYDGIVTATVNGTPAGLQLIPQQVSMVYETDEIGFLVAHDLVFPAAGVGP